MKKPTDKKYGKKGSRGPWAHLDKEKREQHEEIERRIKKKWLRGEI